MKFKEKYRDFQELVREHSLLRKNNLANAENQSQLLLFAEGTLIILMLERFLRMLPALKAQDSETLRPLFKRAVDEKILVISDQHRNDMLDIRNTILHGNFEQAAKQAKVSSKEEYFKTQYASEIEKFYVALDRLVDQIDPETGLRKQSL